MKLHFLSIIRVLILLSIFVGATQCAKTPTNKNTSTDATDDLPPVMIQLNALTSKEYTIKTGNRVYYSAPAHASTGMAVQYENATPTILKLVAETYTFKYEQTPGMTGNDAAVQYYCFEALKKGKAKLTFLKNFRGK